MAIEFRSHLADVVKGLLTSGAYSDFTIACGPDVHPVHKAIICSQSDYFKKAVEFGKEAEEKSITLIDDDPSIVRLMLQYLYESDYAPFLSKADQTFKPKSGSKFPHTCPRFDGFGSGAFSDPECSRKLCKHHKCGRNCNSTCTSFTCAICHAAESVPQQLASEQADHLITHSKMYEMADKYDIQGLKGLVVQKFNRTSALFWSSELFPQAAHIVFSTTPDTDKDLRDIVVSTISNHMQLLEKPEIEELLTEHSGLAFALLKQKSKQYGWQ